MHFPLSPCPFSWLGNANCGSSCLELRWKPRIEDGRQEPAAWTLHTLWRKKEKTLALDSNTHMGGK